MITVKDKVAVITGSTRSIGWAIARLFASEGATVVITGRHEEDCQKRAKEIIDQGGKAIAIRCDVSKQDDIRNMMNEVIEKLGRIDIMVNNVAFSYKEPFLEATLSHVSEAFGVIIGATHLASQLTAKYMIKRGEPGRIINIGSTASLYAERGNSTYCAAKAALLSLTKTMALELGEFNITVNTVNAGSTVREIEKRSEQVLESFRVMGCLPELNRPDDIAPAVAFLASDLAKGITGQTLNVDAGFSVAMQPEKLYQYNEIFDRIIKEEFLH